MDNGQISLLLGAIVLLALLVLNVNRTILASNGNTLQAEAITTANSVAQQTLDLISSKAFDESAVNTNVTDINNFTTAASLGSETGESASLFDDVDDYENYNAAVSTPRIGNVNVLVNVGYVNPSQPDVVVINKTRMKRILVKATSMYMPDTLRLYYYSSY